MGFQHTLSLIPQDTTAETVPYSSIHVAVEVRPAVRSMFYVLCSMPRSMPESTAHALGGSLRESSRVAEHERVIYEINCFLVGKT